MQIVRRESQRQKNTIKLKVSPVWLLRGAIFDVPWTRGWINGEGYEMERVLSATANQYEDIEDQ